MGKNDGSPAFPDVWSRGMSLRDWFAGQSLAGQRSVEGENVFLLASTAAKLAYADADAMLEEREKEG